MHTTPLVSVIIPTYNCFKYLPKAISSIFEQNIHNIEIIIIDDGSTDETWDWLCKESAKHPQIKPYQTRSIGPSAARNYALNVATGEYTAFLDADDYWLPGKLQAQIDFHKSHPDIVLSFTNYLHVDLKHNDLGDCFGFWPSFSKIHTQSTHYEILKNPTAIIYSENVIGTSCVMVSTRTIQDCGKFDVTLLSAEDWDMWLRLSQLGQVGFTNDIGMIYLMRPDSESRNYYLRIQYMKKILDKYRGDISIYNVRHILSAYGRLACAYAEYYLHEEKPIKALLPHILATILTPSTRMFKATLANGIKIFTDSAFDKP
ncbi:MAG: glycosyltransferase family 2 protein [Oleispira sp.]